jgi:predicted neuraminidase
VSLRTLFLTLLLPVCLLAAPAEPKSQLIFPLEHWHNHSSSVVELPNGDLLVTWYNGSGERTADDVKLEASRWDKKTGKWGPRFLLADVPNFPDCNPILWLDPRERLWLFWPTIVANQWHTAILQYRMTTDYPRHGEPVRWNEGGVILFEPQNFEQRVKDVLEPQLRNATEERAKTYLTEIIQRAGDKYYRRMGWMPRNHPIALPASPAMPKGRYILPLYSDGYDFSLVAYSDDEGQTWLGSGPMVGGGAVQPTVVRKRDGGLVSYFRDNGPPPKRVLISESSDNGLSWTANRDTDIFNSGTSNEVIVLQSGEWMMVNNDTERGRHSLALSISDDEGKTWKWKRHIERDTREEKASSFHYPSLIQSADGQIHLTYSLFLNHIPQGQPRKSIKHARFTVDWVKAGNP